MDTIVRLIIELIAGALGELNGLPYVAREAD
jgi:hypothetical protein